MSLANYWPLPEEVDRCIKSEAESVSDEVLLAVHQEFPLGYSIVGPDGKVVSDSRQVASEDDLLRHLLGNAPEGSLVVPITGASGVGKSHLIRILDARLRSLPNASRYLVIRIPKSASLRKVVELILEAEPLQGSKYDSVRAEFEKALADIPLEKAVILFQAQLEIALRDYATELSQQLLQHRTDAELQRRLHVATKLPLLLSDASTADYFHEQILPRVVHRSVEGLSDPNTPINPTDSQFKAADFDFPDSVDITRAAISVQKFYQLSLCALGGQGKKIAADVLNLVVDQATRQLYKLNESLGGKTLGEVIGDIRRLLLEDDLNKELVILVEDFAALVGIQDTLAKILIQHGETDGKKTHATIRSAIAVTDGYLAGRDTLATRAGREWVVESRFESETEVLSRTKRLVASYLNAARHGELTLRSIYQQVVQDGGTKDSHWMAPVFSDGTGENESVLSAFGYIQHVPLFPFTESSIECLAKTTLTAGNTLVFNPRFVIKNIIREVLLSGREPFLSGQFPPPGISGKPPAFEVAEWLASKPLAPDLQKRYSRLICIWGNQPATQADISRIPDLVFEVFKLPLPNISSSKEEGPEKNKTFDTKQGQPPHPPEVVDRRLKEIQAYQAALERWIQDGTLLEQKIANAIRQAIAKLLNQRIDWNAERCLKREVMSDLFSLPNAGGEGRVVADPVKLAQAAEDPEGRLRGDLLSLLRFVDIYKETTDYDEVDDDLARVGNLIDRLLPEVLARFRVIVKKQARSTIALLAVNSRLLGLTEKGRTPNAVASFLFGDVKPPLEVIDGAPQAFKDWRKLQQDAFQVRPSLIQRVLETSACFQGTGKTPQGVDIMGVIDCYPEENATADFSDIPGLTSESELRQVLMTMRPPVVAVRLNQLLEAAKKTQAIITAELGEDFDKQAVIDAAKGVATNLKEMGAWATNSIGFTPNSFFDVCESFRNSAVKEALQTLSDVLLDSSETQPTAVRKVSRVAQMPLSPLLVAEQFIGQSNMVIRCANDHARTLEMKYEGVSPAQKAEELSEVFASLTADLATLQ